jgi:hypothetical protein
MIATNTATTDEPTAVNSRVRLRWKMDTGRRANLKKK